MRSLTRLLRPRAAVEAATAWASRWGSTSPPEPRGRARLCDLGFLAAARGCSSSAAAAASATPSSRVVTGENTREFLVKVSDAELTSSMDPARSSVRGSLITLTSVAAAVYLGYYVSPLVGASSSRRRRRVHPSEPRGTGGRPAGESLTRRWSHALDGISSSTRVTGGGTALSAAQLLKSKDTMFQRTGVSRLRAIVKAGRASFVAPAVEKGAAEDLLRLIISGAGASAPSSRGKVRDASPGMGTGGRIDATREVATEALTCLTEMEAHDEMVQLMAQRSAFVEAVRAAGRDRALEREVREKLSRLHARLAAVAVGQVKQ